MFNTIFYKHFETCDVLSDYYSEIIIFNKFYTIIGSFLSKYYTAQFNQTSKNIKHDQVHSVFEKS